ncbi:MAG TPA: trypsin-like peptidase domain-containing protein [Acidimicrobiales bacterium]|nr:trypsin-like peptidase domain-containing protein [Acidimicrobiales bacterium]
MAVVVAASVRILALATASARARLERSPAELRVDAVENRSTLPVDDKSEEITGADLPGPPSSSAEPQTSVPQTSVAEPATAPTPPTARVPSVGGESSSGVESPPVPNGASRAEPGASASVPIVPAGWPLPQTATPVSGLPSTRSAPDPSPTREQRPLDEPRSEPKKLVRRPPSWLAVSIVSALIGAAVGAGIAAAFASGSKQASPTSVPSPAVSKSSPGPALAGGASIPVIAQKVLPEVVSIDAKGPGASNSSGGFPFGLPFGSSGSSGTVEDQGTGMILPGGEVLTNNHVIAGATSITVTLYNQTSALPATVIGTDSADDVALLQITNPPANLQTITFGSSQDLQVGDAVVAIGNALGLSAGTPTVTSGIVSALGRTVEAGDTGSGATETLTNIIQTDAAINPGNSGGPLVDSSGDVIGMNTAVASSSGNNASAQNIGFAIPESNLEALLPQLRKGGVHGSNAYMGIEIQDITPQLRQEYGFEPTQGALVDAVTTGSPAESAGVEAGDVIVAYNGKAVTSAQDVTTDVRASKPGDKVTLTVWRGTEKLSIEITLGTQPAS